VSLFVDTSAWSLALRHDRTPSAPEVGALRDALEGGDLVLTTGLVLRELLRGFAGPRARKDIDRFAALPLLPRSGRSKRERTLSKSQQEKIHG